MISPLLITVLSAHAVSILGMLSVSLFMFFKKRSFLTVLFLAIIIATALFEISFIFTPLAATFETAYLLSFLNVFVYLLQALIIHLLFALIDQAKRYRWYIYGFYAISILGMLTSLLFPNLFIQTVAEKGIFFWYPTGGVLWLFMNLSFYVGLLFPIYKIIQTYRSDPETQAAKRGMYFFLFFIIGLPIGYSNTALVFDYPVTFHPLVGSFIAFSLIPLAYGIIADDLLDIRIIAKRALVYSLGIAGSVAALALLISLNNILVAAVPWVQFWTVPVFTGAVAFIIGRVVWVQSAESDRLKYEFVTVATHKLRTPLTQMSWGLKALKEEELSLTAKQSLKQVERANERLIELTNLLFETTQEKTDRYTYTKERIELLSLTREVLKEFGTFIESRDVNVNIHSEEPVEVVGDQRRLRSVIEVLIENAISYSETGGLVQIITYIKGGRAYFSVRDQGIGIKTEDQSRIFNRFYRTDEAKRKDTEGLGLGLAVSKSIIKAHKGKIGVESHGLGKGSTFWFWIPAKR